MNKNIYILFTALFMTACTNEYVMPLAMHYTPAKTVSKSATTIFGHPKDAVFSAATTALIKSGYQINQSDLDDGILSTQAQRLPLNDTQADCGVVKQTNPLPDNKTATNVIMNVTIIAHKLTVQTEINGLYQPTNTKLNCTSKGILEQEMVKKIRAEIR